MRLSAVAPLLRGALLVFCLAAPGAKAEQVRPLPAVNADIAETSISGISSGAFMAVQFATAWSSIVKGVGAVAGGPYYCAQASKADVWNGFTLPIIIATGPCMKGPAPDQFFFVREADAKAASGEIDPTANLARQKVYLFHGFNDSVVAEPVTDATADFYRHYMGQAKTGNLFYQTMIGAGHAQISARPPRAGLNACPANRAPFINACAYDQAGIILQYIYGALEPPRSRKLSGKLRAFSQGRYTGSEPPGALSMADVGYVFTPKDCEPEQGAPCRVHIALHGCGQDARDIGTLYVRDAGYNAWADANRIIVVYPQTAKHPANPKACWDWWSYLARDDSYVTKSGRQIAALKSMLDALTAGRKPGPPPVAAQGVAPSKLIVIDVADRAAALAFTPVAGAEAYRIYRAAADGDFAPVGAALGPSFADVGLAPATSYRWQVTAVVSGVEGPPSPAAAAMSLPSRPPCDSPGRCPLGQARK